MASGQALAALLPLAAAPVRHTVKADRVAMGAYQASIFILPMPDMVPGILESDSNGGGIWFVAGGGGFAGFTEAPLSYFGHIDHSGRLDLYKIPASGVLTNGVAVTNRRIILSEYLGNRISLFDRATGKIQRYPIATPDARPTGVCAWGETIFFCENAGNKIGVISAGKVVEYPIPTHKSRPTGIVALPGKRPRVAFSELYGNKIGVMNEQGSFREFDLPSPRSRPTYLINGRRPGSVLVCARGANQLVEVHCGSGQARPIALPRGAEAPFGVKFGADGATWLAAMQSNELLRIDARGQRTERLGIPIQHAMPGGLAIDSAGRAWTSLHGANALLCVHT